MLFMSCAPVSYRRDDLPQAEPRPVRVATPEEEATACPG